MIISILKQAFRTLFRNRLYSLINLFGLGLGILVCSLLALFTLNEMGFEKFHKDNHLIMRLAQENQMDANTRWKFPYLAGSFAPTMKDEFPEIEYASRMYFLGGKSVKYGENEFTEHQIMSVEPDFLNIFTFPLISGDITNCLNEPHQILINEKMASKYFGEENPLGKSLIIDGTEQYEVTGVLKNIPESTHLTFDFLTSYATLENNPEWAWLNSWYTGVSSYIKLVEGTNASAVEERFPELISRLQPDQTNMRLFLQPINEIHLYASDFQFDYNAHPSSRKYLYLLSAIGLGVLFMACFNFINLSTARSLHRSKEVGLRKTVGATKSQLVFHFIVESMLISLLTLIPIILALEIVIPYFNDLLEINVSLTKNGFFIPIMVLFTLIVGFASGLYPSVVLSSYLPSRILSGTYDSGKKGAFIRKSLVFAQFAITIILLISTGIINSQIKYMQNKPLGFNKEHVVFVHLYDEVGSRSFESIRELIEEEPGVISTSGSQVIPGRIAQDHVIPDGYTGDDPWTICMNIVDDGYMETLGIELIEGRSFDPARPSDKASIIINETAKKEFGWDSIDGKNLTQSGGNKRVFPVIGMVKDFHSQSLHSKIEPAMLVYYPKRSEYLCIKIQSDNFKETIDNIAYKWSEIVPDKPFDYHFLDEMLENWYVAEERTVRIITLFSFLAIVIACLGLFGLVSYAVERKTKEISVRKVLGASTQQIVLLLSKEFILIVIIANLFAWPIAYYMLNKWMANFAYRNTIEAWIFFIVGILVLLVVGITMSAKTFYAAGINPSISLRDE